MEALEFLKEAKRKCSSTTCEVCRNESYAVLCPLSEYPDEEMEKLVSGVEQWSKEHPIITNAQKFKEVFGFSVEDKYTMRSDVTDWLNKPYKEPEHED